MPRADARRNRDLILAAAKELFSERGATAPLDDIARQAGVGNATLYRHFPTRLELLIAVYSDEVTDLTARGGALLSQKSPADALFTWLGEFIAHVADKSDLAHAIPAEGRTPLFNEWHGAMHTTLHALLTRAQEAAAIRPDLNETDLLALANGIALAGAGPAQTGRLLQLAREGIAIPPQRRPGSDHPESGG
jgi:AcrR family transcriptional regulator